MQTVNADEVTAKAAHAIDSLEPTATAEAPSKSREFMLWDYQAAQQVRREYQQAELGFLPAQRFFMMVNKKLKGFVDGEFGVTIGELFGGGGDLRQQMKMPDELSETAVNDAVSQNEPLIRAFFTLVEMMPDLQMDIIALSLGVPRGEANWFRNAIEEPPARGGLTIDEGFELLEYFVIQNAGALRRFFTKKGRNLVEVINLYVIHQGQLPKPPEDTATSGGTPSSTSSLATPASV